MRKSLIKSISIFTLTVFLIPMNVMSNDTVVNEKYSRIVWGYLEKLCEFGPRNPGSKGNRDTIKLISRVGMKYADRVVDHPFTVQLSKGKTISMVNLELQFAGTEGGAPILIGSHFDTRPFAEQETDPKKQIMPILGANDGGSSTAVLLGLAPVSYTHLTLPTIYSV